MRITTLTLVLLAFLAWPFVTQAQGTDDGGAKEVLKNCKHYINFEDEGLTGACVWYVAGVTRGFQFGVLHVVNTMYADDVTAKYQLLLPYRLPGLEVDSISLDQRIRIVVKYLEDHPEQHHVPVYVLVVAALKEAFPCKSG